MDSETTFQPCCAECGTTLTECWRRDFVELTDVVDGKAITLLVRYPYLQCPGCHRAYASPRTYSVMQQAVCETVNRRINKQFEIYKVESRTLLCRAFNRGFFLSMNYGGGFAAVTSVASALSGNHWALGAIFPLIYLLIWLVHGYRIDKQLRTVAQKGTADESAKC